MANICTSTLKIHANEKTMDELVQIFGKDLSLDVEQIVPTLFPEHLRAKAFEMITGSDKIDGWASIKTPHGTRQAPAWYLAGIMSGIEDKTWFFDALFKDNETLKNHIDTMSDVDFKRMEKEIRDYRIGCNGFEPTDPDKQNSEITWYIDSNWDAPIGFVRQLSRTLKSYEKIEFSFIESGNNIGGVFVSKPGEVIIDKRHDAYINIAMDMAIDRGLTIRHVKKYLKEPFSEWSLDMDNDDYETDYILEKIGFIMAAVNQPVYDKIDDVYRIAMLMTLEMNECCDYTSAIQKLRNDLEHKFPLLTKEQQCLADLILPEDACLFDVATIISGTKQAHESNLPEVSITDIPSVDFLHVSR